MLSQNGEDSSKNDPGLNPPNECDSVWVKVGGGGGEVFSLDLDGNLITWGVAAEFIPSPDSIDRVDNSNRFASRACCSMAS